MKSEAQTSTRIMVVDDNPTNLRVLRDYLTEFGFRTLIAEDGEGALRQVMYAQPDLILLDVMMPNLDGFETCRRLKAMGATKDIPVIFMTALSETSDKIKGFEAGAVDFITKPFQQEEVLARINTHLTIQRQRKELAMLNATKDKFFSIIAHDLRGIFHTLLGASELLVNAIQTGDLKKTGRFATMVQESAQVSHSLMENLLDWARIQRGVMDMKPENLDLDAIFQEIAKIFARSAKNKTIELDFQDPAGIVVLADRNMLNTIIRNLVSNALKFTENGGRIRAWTEQANQELILKVSDTGIGMSAEEVKKVFMIHEKHRRPGTAGERGTGLGLLLCKELAEKLGGELAIESEPGRGTTFSLRLPTPA